jgi:hypothetical protein
MFTIVMPYVKEVISWKITNITGAQNPISCPKDERMLFSDFTVESQNGRQGFSYSGGGGGNHHTVIWGATIVTTTSNYPLSLLVGIS